MTDNINSYTPIDETRYKNYTEKTIMNRKKIIFWDSAALCLLLMFVIIPVQAMSAHEQLADARLEAVARQIGKGLYCPVCSGQTIDDSQAPLASALRAFIREQLRMGLNRATIQHDLVARFGESILLEPQDPWLWALPFMMVGALLGLVVGIRKRWWWRGSFKRTNN